MDKKLFVNYFLIIIIYVAVIFYGPNYLFNLGFVRIGNFLRLLMGSLIIISPFWVFFDAYTYKKKGVNVWSPLGWAIIVFLFWVITFPMYLANRKEFKSQLK